MNDDTKRWDAMLASIQPDRSSHEILFDPLIEDWAFAGLSDSFRQQLRDQQEAEQQRAVLLDRLRWIIQKRLMGREREAMLLYLAGCSQNQIAGMLGISRSTVKRDMQLAGTRLKQIVGATDRLPQGIRRHGLCLQILPLDSEEDMREFLTHVSQSDIRHLALGTFADLREVLVISAEASQPV